MSVEWVKEMITEGEGKKRMELDEKVNVLVAELERERKKCQRKGRRRSQELERGSRQIKGESRRSNKGSQCYQGIELKEVKVGMDRTGQIK